MKSEIVRGSDAGAHAASTAAASSVKLALSADAETFCLRFATGVDTLWLDSIELT
jgi:hypothetical protein